MATTGIDFCTLGMFIIDDIYPPPSSPDQTPHLSIPGGAGTYSAIGARLFSPPPSSQSVGWIIDTGTDFPPDLQETILSWQTSAVFRPRPNSALTTRGWNGYGENEHRAFKYLTEKKRLTAEDLTPKLLAARSVHLICSPGRCIELVTTILERRKSLSSATVPPLPRPAIIWEPVPDLCIPSELEKAYAALPHIDILSPNHEELSSFFSFTHPPSHIDKAAIERQSNEFLARGIGPSGNGSIAVRVGKEGCFVANLNRRRWMPAYHCDPSRVVDPTGGGNGFLGGFAVGYVRSGRDVFEAARWGSVAASFCIEQAGVPILETLVQSRTCTDEVWNGESVVDRLDEYRKRSA